VSKGGIAVRAVEPDWRIPYYDSELGIAVKRLDVASPDAFFRRVKAGAWQIKAQGIRGIVMLNVDVLVGDLSVDVDAASYGAAFNERLGAFQESLDDRAPYPSLIGVALTGMVGQWLFPPGKGPQFYSTVPFQLIGFTETEPEERFDQFFRHGYMPRLRIAIEAIAAITAPR
jgi:hypothetical protein